VGYRINVLRDKNDNELIVIKKTDTTRNWGSAIQHKPPKNRTFSASKSSFCSEILL